MATCTVCRSAHTIHRNHLTNEQDLRPCIEVLGSALGSLQKAIGDELLSLKSRVAALEAIIAQATQEDELLEVQGTAADKLPEPVAVPSVNVEPDSPAQPADAPTTS